MKKILLLAAAACMAASMSAEVFPQAVAMSGEDITPAGYKFNTYDKEFIGAPNINGTFQAMPWQLGNDWYLTYSSADGFEFGDGLIGLSCPPYTGPQYKPENFDAFNAGTKIVDLGGTCGKVLAMNFAGSNFPAAYKNITGQDLEIGEVVAANTVMNFWMNPAVVSRYAGIQRDGADYMPMRARVEMNIYTPLPANTIGSVKAFMQNDNGNVLPVKKDDNLATDILVAPFEFAYRWCEKDETSPDDDSVWDEGETSATWNPNRWLVYEWDFNAPDIENEGDPFCNVKMKMEMPGAGSGGITVLIRSINIYVPENANREYVYKQRPRTWNFYTTGAVEGVKTIATPDEAVKYSINGNSVNFSAPAKVYTISGALVAEGTNMNLAKGVYVALCGTKAVKLLVK